MAEVLRRLLGIHRRAGRPRSSTTWSKPGSSRTRSSSTPPTTAPRAKARPNGSVNENKFFNGYPDELAENMKLIDELGGPDTYEHFPTGWAVAFSTPFQMFKRYSQYSGGTTDPLVISWPKGIKARGEIRDQYHHSVDIVPTILDIVGLEMPKVYRGVEQFPLSGVSMTLHVRCQARRADARRSASTTRCSARAASGRTAGWRPPCMRRSPARAISTRTSGSSTTSMWTVRSRRTWRRSIPRS